MIDTANHALIVGPYRAHNFGDDLVGGILAKHLQSLGYTVTIPRLSESNSQWLGTHFTEGFDSVFETSDIVVVGGGGIMSDTSGAKPGASYLDIVAKAERAGKLTGKKVYVTSVGAGPWMLDHTRELAAEVSALAEKVGVREQESFDNLRAIGVSPDKLVLGADVALLTPDYLTYPTTRTRRFGLQFDVSAFNDVQGNPDLPAIVRMLGQHARRHPLGVTLIRNGRSKSELAKAAPWTPTLCYTELESFLPELAGLRGILTSHLHLAITAYAHRIPTYSVYVREKTRRFYDQIGHPERAIDLRHATVADVREFLHAARRARWTDADEATLQRLKGEARSLLEFVR